jgi:hypothetical protein
MYTIFHGRTKNPHFRSVQKFSPPTLLANGIAFIYARGAYFKNLAG